MKRWIVLGGGLAAVALAAELAAAVPMRHVIGDLVTAIRGAGPLGMLAYAAAYITLTALLVPGTLLTAGAGLAYGPWRGLLLVSPVSVAAATIAFLLGRTVARRWIARRVAEDPRFHAIDVAIGRHGFTVVLLLRLSPVFPFNVLNYALGLTRVGLRDYVLGSLVGMLPATFLYVYIGSLAANVAALADGDVAAGSGALHVLRWTGLAMAFAVTIFVANAARRALRDELAGTSTVAPPPVRP